jgi:hypothetical protein
MQVRHGGVFVDLAVSILLVGVYKAGVGVT